MSDQGLAVMEGGRAIGARVEIDAGKLELIGRTIAPDLDQDELLLFAEVCKRQGLDPFRRQIYASKVQGRMVIMTSIDGFRIEAERTGLYRGQIGPEWCGEDGRWVDVWLGQGSPAAARVGVLREGWPQPLWGVANWEAFNQGRGQWPKMGPHMLAKCAEALALRKTFPDALGGMYVQEEMDQATADTGAPAQRQAARPPQARQSAPPVTNGGARTNGTEDPNRPLKPAEIEELMERAVAESSVNWGDLETAAREALKTPSSVRLQVKHRGPILAAIAKHPLQQAAIQ